MKTNTIGSMTLENAIKDFKNDHTNKRKMICDGHYSKYGDSCDTGAFDNIVEALLKGYLEVKHGNKTVQCIQPTCIEIYYHEEDSEREAKLYVKEIEESLLTMYSCNQVPENLLIHDFIVYHRNTPFTKKELFKETAILNNHQSGIDIAFEFPTSLNGRIINIRASALIRGFIHTENHKEISYNEAEIDDRSTYLYDFLYPYASILGDGMSIKWVDDPKLEAEIDAIERKNVFQYKMDDCWLEDISKKQPRKSLDYAIKIEKKESTVSNKKFEPDKRKLRFYNKKFYTGGEPK